MPISVKLLNDQIKKISETNALLDMLMEFESVLDSLGLYVYTNWIEGEVLAGPHLKRHWINVSLMYLRDEMPDPEGALRLMDRGCLVKYRKQTLIRPVKVTSFDDVVPETRPDGSVRYRAKTHKEPIWIVDISMPRRYVDEFEADLAGMAEEQYADETETENPSDQDAAGDQGMMGDAGMGMGGMPPNPAMGGMPPPAQF